MPQPGQPQPRGEDWLVRKVQELERSLQELKAANPFAPMGMKPDPNGVTFGGSVVINGNLAVPNGSISNDALQNPLSTGSAGLSAYNMATTTTAADYGSSTMTVPAGFTKALVTNGVSAGAMNSSGSSDYIYVASGIYTTVGGARTGGETATFALNGSFGSASAFGITNIVGLAGGQTITVSARIRTGANAWAAAPGNFVNVNAVAIFYR